MNFCRLLRLSYRRGHTYDGLKSLQQDIMVRVASPVKPTWLSMKGHKQVSNLFHLLLDLKKNTATVLNGLPVDYTLYAIYINFYKGEMPPRSCTWVIWKKRQRAASKPRTVWESCPHSEINYLPISPPFWLAATALRMKSKTFLYEFTSFL